MEDVIKKLKFKTQATVINAPSVLKREFLKLGLKTGFSQEQKQSNVLVFVNNKKEFLQFLEKEMKNLEPDGVLWFAYPKGTANVVTDINRDILWKLALDYGIRPVSIISLDDTWSALRFKPTDQVGKK